MADYEFVTVWRAGAPREQVWDAIYRSDDWPAWWRGVERVVEVEPGDERGVGSLRRYTWRSKLPYRLTFDMRTLRIEPLVLLEGAAEGELTGMGRWQFVEDGPATVVRYNWKVRTTKPWMNAVSPVARPLFAWNHDVVMNWGAEGLARRLGARVVSVRAAR